MCLLAFGVQSVSFIRHNSVTFDETSHLAAGVSAWRTGDFRLLCSWPLVLMGAQVPRQEGWEQGRAITLANEIAAAYPGTFHHLVMAGRAVTAFLMILFGLLLALDARRAFGNLAGLVAALLFSFQPMLIAHGSLMTVDALAAFFYYLAVRTFLRFQGQGRFWF